MERILIYQTIFLEKSTDLYCVYVGSHRTKDDLWPGPGCKDPYIGSCTIAMKKYKDRIMGERGFEKDGWEWIATSVLEESDGSRSTLAIEGEWIYSAMVLFGIHPLAKSYIRFRDPKHPLLKIRDGSCLNCHKNSDKFEGTQYYKDWLKGQGYRSVLGNTKESREKAKLTRLSHIDKIREIQRTATLNFLKTDAGKDKSKRFNLKGNSSECREKARITRYSHMDQWVCVNDSRFGELPIRRLSESLGLGRGAQQCWSRLGKPDKFEFRGYLFKLVRKKTISSSE